MTNTKVKTFFHAFNDIEIAFRDLEVVAEIVAKIEDLAFLLSLNNVKERIIKLLIFIFSICVIVNSQIQHLDNDILIYLYDQVDPRIAANTTELTCSHSCGTRIMQHGMVLTLKFNDLMIMNTINL